MLYYRITYLYIRGQEFSVNPGAEHLPEGMDGRLTSLPEGEWCDDRERAGVPDRGKPYRDPHGFLERYTATEVGRMLEGVLGWPMAVRVEVEETVP